MRALKVLGLCIGAASVCALVFVVMLRFSLPPSDEAYGMPVTQFLTDPFVFFGAVYGAAFLGALSFPFAYFATRNRRLFTSTFFIFGAVIMEILLVTPFAGWGGLVGSVPALGFGLLVCKYSDWKWFAQTEIYDSKLTLREPTVRLKTHWANQNWLWASVGGVIGMLSLAILFLAVPRIFFDYIVFPLVKDAYILPQWRYRVFDIVLLSWCADGLITAVLLLRTATTKQALGMWARRAFLLYFAGLAVLIGGVALGIWLRSHGL